MRGMKKWLRTCECTMHYAWMVSYANDRNHARRAKTEWKWVLYGAAVKESPEERSHTSHSYEETWPLCTLWQLRVQLYRESYTDRLRMRHTRFCGGWLSGRRPSRKIHWIHIDPDGDSRKHGVNDVEVRECEAVWTGRSFSVWLFMGSIYVKTRGRRSTWWIFKIERMERKPVRV